MPVQLTCAMTAQALKAAASRVAALHAGQAVKAAAGLPVKLAGKHLLPRHLEACSCVTPHAEAGQNSKLRCAL